MKRDFELRCRYDGGRILTESTVYRCDVPIAIDFPQPGMDNEKIVIVGGFKNTADNSSAENDLRVVNIAAALRARIDFIQLPSQRWPHPGLDEKIACKASYSQSIID